MSTTKTISIDLSELLSEIQPREEMSKEGISEYEETIRNSKKDEWLLPPIDVFHMDSESTYKCVWIPTCSRSVAGRQIVDTVRRPSRYIA